MKKCLTSMLAIVLALSATALAYDADRLTISSPGVEREISLVWVGNQIRAGMRRP